MGMNDGNWHGDMKNGYMSGGMACGHGDGCESYEDGESI